MTELLVDLVPLILGSALVPTQILIAVLLLRHPGGRATTLALIAGMLTVRLVQGVAFGLILQPAAEADAADGQPHTIVSIILVILAVVLLATALRQLLAGDGGDRDEDDPPPRWMTLLDGISPARAYAFGAALTGIGIKLWVFTIGAVAAIADAQLGQPSSTVAFLVYAIAASGVLLALLAFAFIAPARADATLGRLNAFLVARNREILIVVSSVFGTWFLIKGLTGLGVLG